MNNKVSILIADDHPIVRQGMRQIIGRVEDFEVVCECGNGEDAVKSARSLMPDVVIMDIDMPLLNGLQALKSLREKSFRGKVILMTVHSEEEFFNEAIELGANGYVLKDSATEDVVSAIRAVLAGHSYVSPALTTLLLKKKRTVSANGTSRINSLSATEVRILAMIAEYKTTSQIAKELFISPLTVKTHRRNISVKLELEGSHALMKFAVEHAGELDSAL